MWFWILKVEIQFLYYEHGQGYLLLENKEYRYFNLLRVIIPFNTIADRIVKSVNGRNRDRAQRCSCPWHLKNAVKVWNLRSCSDKGISLFLYFLLKPNYFKKQRFYHYFYFPEVNKQVQNGHGVVSGQYHVLNLWNMPAQYSMVILGLFIYFRQVKMMMKNLK